MLPRSPIPVDRTPALTFAGEACHACGKVLQVCATKAVQARLLDVDGWTLCNVVPKRCRNSSSQCHLSGVWFWQNYFVRDAKHLFCWPQETELEFFFLSNRWGVSCRWLRQMSQRLCRQYISFQSEASIHDIASSRDASVTPPSDAEQKLKCAWFAWRLLLRRAEKDVAEGRTPPGFEFNLSDSVEDMCAQVSNWYFEYMFDQRLHMYTNTHEHALSTVVIDGNAKLTRRVCGRDVGAVMECACLNAFTATKCPNKPAFKRKWCGVHESGTTSINPAVDASSGVVWPEMVEAHRRLRRDMTSNLPEPYEVRMVYREMADNPASYYRRWCPASDIAKEQLQEYWSRVRAQAQQGGPTIVAAASTQRELASSSCSTHKESTAMRTKSSRSTGWLFACAEDGFIIHLKEFIGAESLAQRYFFLAEIKSKAPNLRVVVHDDACHLRRYSDARRSASSIAADLAYPTVTYVVDHMHFKGHVDPWCRQQCDPKSAANAPLMEHVNSAACEQLFARLGRHKFSVRGMNQLTAAVFLNEMSALRNQD